MSLSLSLISAGALDKSSRRQGGTDNAGWQRIRQILLHGEEVGRSCTAGGVKEKRNGTNWSLHTDHGMPLDSWERAASFP